MKTTLLLILALFATLLFSAVSIASLGEAEASIEDDCLAVSGMEGPPQVREGYTVHPVIADGVTLREFTTPGGIVFGVAWDGVRTPDLTRILGSFSTECEDASKGARAPGRRSLAIDTGNVVFERWGHQRNLQGRAYVPVLVPKGVDVNEIR